MRPTSSWRNRVARIRPTPALLLLLLLMAREAGARDLWPLVNDADFVAWGTLEEVIDGDEDCLLVISARGGTDAWGARGPATLRILERSGRLPEGTSLRVGATGIFLCHSDCADPEAFRDLDGCLIAGGFAPLAQAAGHEESIVGLFVALKSGGALDPAPLLRLLDSTEPALRALGLAGLGPSPAELDDVTLAELGRRFRAEQSETVLGAYLELFQLRGWPLGGARAPDLLLGCDEPALQEVALGYLQRFPTVEDAARLLAAWPGADRRERLLLLEAFARAGIREAAPFIEEAVLGDEPELIEQGLRCLTATGSNAAHDVMAALLGSRSERVRRMALTGLASLATPEAGEVLRGFIERSERASSDQRLRALAERILKHPHRYARGPIGESEARKRETVTAPAK